jgi:ATP-dependent DNA helicase RecG
MSLEESIQTIKGVGPKLGKILSDRGIATVEDALYFLPRAYQDRSKITPIRQVMVGTDVTIFGRIRKVSEIGFGRSKRVNAEVEDASGRLKLVWFNAYPSLLKELTEGAEILAFGTATLFGAVIQIVHPEFEIVDEQIDGKPVTSEHFGRVVPIYSEPEGVHQKVLRKITAQALEANLQTMEDPLPIALRNRLKLPTLGESFVNLHFPKKMPVETLTGPEVTRLAFEEFFVLQLGLALKKREREADVAPAINVTVDSVSGFKKGLPFEFTGDQQSALSEILEDLRKPQAMRRLVQGDVGSGKTAVALAALAVVAKDGYQGAFMAPTEVLAIQHFATAKKYLEPMGITCALLTHSTPDKPELFNQVRTGKIQVLIGTHALFQQTVEFEGLALAVVDEQHRFGVVQRAELLKKGKALSPHLLMMTATPIPRTLALTVYGDLDISWIREKPKGRAPIQTRVMRERDRMKVYDQIRRTLTAGQQGYLIYPLVENSDKLDLRSSTDMYERLRREVFPDFKLGLLHGRMKSEQKEEILNRFKAGQIQLLISTTVIEVGIDVPNATLMVIEHPERLGLSQLHQLRGRVGRGSAVSHCVLLCDEFVTQRLRIMEKTEDGFEIAEEDMRLRGPGEFLGTRQSGLPGFRVGHIVRDAALLRIAREEAQALLKADPNLEAPENSLIKKMVLTRWKDKIERLGDG